MKELAPLKKLDVLNLGGTSVTNLKEVAAFDNLADLGLSSTKVRDEDLKQLASLKKLTKLSLSNARVSDEGMKILTKFKGLTTLSVGSTAAGQPTVTDAGLKELVAQQPTVCP